MRARSLAGALALGASAGLICTDAAAQTQEARVCATAYHDAQVLRDSGKLILARAQLQVCLAACPATLTPDCDGWLEDVDGRMPSVVPILRDGQGRLVSAARVSMDGKVVAHTVDLRPIEVDPGQHVFVFELADGGRVETIEDVRPGTRGQRILARLEGDAAAPVEEPAAAPPSAPLPRAGTIDTPPTGPLILAGVGGLGLLLGGVLAIKGHLDRQDLYDCKPRCPQAEADSIRTTWAVAGVSAAVGGLAVGGAALWWMLDPKPGPARPNATTSRWRLVVGSGLAVGGDF